MNLFLLLVMKAEVSSETRKMKALDYGMTSLCESEYGYSCAKFIDRSKCECKSWLVVWKRPYSEFSADKIKTTVQEAFQLKRPFFYHNLHLCAQISNKINCL